MDKFRKYLVERRVEFDKADVDNRVWERIEQSLKDKNRKTGNIIPFKRLYFAAASVILAAAIFLVIKMMERENSAIPAGAEPIVNKSDGSNQIFSDSIMKDLVRSGPPIENKELSKQDPDQIIQRSSKPGKRKLTIDDHILQGINNTLLANEKELKRSFLSEFRRLQNEMKKNGTLEQQKIYLLQQINYQIRKLEFFHTEEI